MFDHPWALLFFVALIPVFFLRRNKYFVKIGSLIKHAPYYKKKKGKIIWKEYFPSFLFISGISLLILSAGDLWIGYSERSKKYLLHNYVLINDGSGSMTMFKETIPALLFGNKTFFDALKESDRKDNERDLVAQIVFSNGAYVISYFREDYDNLMRKMELVDWKTSPLNQGTDAGSGFWSAIQLALKKNVYNGGHNYSPEEMKMLIARSRGWEGDLKLNKALEEKTTIIRQELTGYVFIVFTDGVFDLGSTPQFISPKKTINLCERLGITVYIISVGSANVDLQKLVRATGGDMLFLKTSKDRQAVATLYKKIAERESRSTKNYIEQKKHYYYRWFALPAFTLLSFWIVLKNTVSRSLTES